LASYVSDLAQANRNEKKRERDKEKERKNREEMKEKKRKRKEEGGKAGRQSERVSVRERSIVARVHYRGRPSSSTANPEESADCFPASLDPKQFQECLAKPFWEC
jgi:hypothetical protein